MKSDRQKNRKSNIFFKKNKSILLESIVFLFCQLFLFCTINQSLAATKPNNTNTNSVNNNSNSNASNINSNSNTNQNSNSDPNKQLELQKKQEQLRSVQNKIDTFQDRVDVLEQKTDIIQSTLQNLDAEIASIEEAITKTEKDLNDTQRLVNDKEHEIVLKEDEIDKKKIFLTEYLRQINLLDKKTIPEILLEKPRLSDYFQEIDDIFSFQNRLRSILADLHNSRMELAQQKDALDETKNEQFSLFSMQDEQRITLEEDKKEREELLAEAQGEQSKYQDMIDNGQSIAQKLSAEISSLQSCGESINIDDAIREAKIVSQLTGVRAAFLLGVLKIESNMGTNVGGGRYKTDMNPAQWDRFKSICTALGYDPNDKPVSRKPCYRDSKGNCGGWGGAMGPAQFMPSTWMGYRDAVAATTGHNPPNPWNLEDALTAMGLKLSKVAGVTDHNESAERKAASMYLAGGNWDKFTWYGDRVMRYASAYEDRTK